MVRNEAHRTGLNLKQYRENLLRSVNRDSVQLTDGSRCGSDLDTRAETCRLGLAPQVGLTAGDYYHILANMLADERREFGGFLRGLRASHHLTLRALAETSKVPFPNISAIECGRLGAGRIIARKLAQGLGLRGSEKERFLAHAAFTNSRDRLSKEHLAYPAALANLLPHMLRAQGVKPQEIVETLWEDPEVIQNPQRFVGERSGPLWLKPELARYWKKERAKATIVVVFLRDGRQIALRCEACVF